MQLSLLQRSTCLSLVTVVLLAAGCAKQPAQDALTTPASDPAATTATAPVEPSATAPAAIREEPVVEAPVAVAQVTAQKTASQLISELTRINFDYDQHVLTPQAQEKLAANAEIIKANPNLNVRIEGHCDERGSDQYNIALGERRAQATKNYLTTLGVPAGQLGTVSFGEEKPLDPGHSEEAWMQNRRAEFVPAP
jgi:peptidoglycan-associated lipoprotein